MTKSEAIFLTGSTSSGETTVSLDLTPEETPADAAASESTALASANTPTNEELDALIAHLMQSDANGETDARNDEQPSVEFFGTRAYGDQFVFLLDISYSMNARKGERFTRACDELMRAISKLQPGQSYYVFLFCWNYQELFHEQKIDYVAVEEGHAKRLRRWIYNVSLGPGTDPRRVLSLAREMDPDAVFLLSDGQFNQPISPMSETGWLNERDKEIELSVQQGVEKFYQDIPIHTVAFENPFTRRAMARISDATSGEFKYVRTRSLQPIDSERFVELLKKIKRKHPRDSGLVGEYQTRLSITRELISDGELLYAEYIMRPLMNAPRELILNPKRFDELTEILRSEVGSRRLEEFEHPPDLDQTLPDGESRPL